MKKNPGYAKELALAKSIALKAGKVMMKYYDADQGTTTKSDDTFVTKADIEINDMVIRALSRKFPDDGVIGEEKSNAEYGMGRKWFCDPIDGTAGYVWGVPTAMFSLALVVDGRSEVGVVYDPFQKRMYHSVRGSGAFCNDKRIHVSSKKLAEGILAVTGVVANIGRLTYVPELRKNKVRLATFSGLVHKCILVARGKFVGFIDHPEKRLAPSAHDLAAVAVIVEEAGGMVTDLDGVPFSFHKPIRDMNGMLISNGVIHADLLQNYEVKIDLRN